MYTTHPLKPSDWKELYPDNLDLAWVIPLRLTLAGKEMLLALGKNGKGHAIDGPILHHGVPF